MSGALLYFLGRFPKLNTAKLAKAIRKAGGVLLPAGLAFVLTKNPGLALVAAMLAYWFGKGRARGGNGRASRGMGVDEAYLVLGLGPGATRSDVQAAHRDLMKRFHPDRGGSTYLAAKVNEAKDVLLKRLRT